MVWEINMGVCPRFELYNIMHICCVGYDYYVHFIFYVIPLSIYDVMYAVTTKLRVPCYNHVYSNRHIM